MPLNLLMAHFWFSCFHVLTLVSFGLATGRWFSLGTPVSSTNKTYRHDITEIFFESGIKHNKPKPTNVFRFLHNVFLQLYIIQAGHSNYGSRVMPPWGGWGGGRGRRESMSYGYILPFYFYKQIEYYT